MPRLSSSSQGVESATAPNGRREPQASESDLEGLWQLICLRFDDDVPGCWRQFRQVVAQVLLLGGVGGTPATILASVRGQQDRFQEFWRRVLAAHQDNPLSIRDAYRLKRLLHEDRFGPYGVFKPAAGGRESSR